MRQQKKPVKQTAQRQLTQAELLAEAARTEIENTRSLQYLVALEEETKKKANMSRGKYVGPMIRFKSCKGKDGLELSTIEARNMQPPSFMLPSRAPEPPQREVCVITKCPAKYKDPMTGMPYADAAAFKLLRQRHH